MKHDWRDLLDRSAKQLVARHMASIDVTRRAAVAARLATARLEATKLWRTRIAATIASNDTQPQQQQQQEKQTQIDAMIEQFAFEFEKQLNDF